MKIQKFLVQINSKATIVSPILIDRQEVRTNSGHLVIYILFRKIVFCPIMGISCTKFSTRICLLFLMCKLKTSVWRCSCPWNFPFSTGKNKKQLLHHLKTFVKKNLYSFFYNILFIYLFKVKARGTVIVEQNIFLYIYNNILNDVCFIIHVRLHNNIYPHSNDLEDEIYVLKIIFL